MSRAGQRCLVGVVMPSVMVPAARGRRREGDDQGEQRDRVQQGPTIPSVDSRSRQNKPTVSLDTAGSGRVIMKSVTGLYLDGEVVASPSGTMYTDVAGGGLLPLCST